MNTQLATGKYTTVAQMPAKIIHEPNLARSAMAPEMSATVMIAKVAWKATNARVGYAPAGSAASAVAAPSRKLLESNSQGDAAVPSMVGNAIA